MTAGNHRIIIEKGADFNIDVQISEDGLNHKDVTGYSVSMVIKYEDTDGTVAILDTIAGRIVPDAGVVVDATTIVVGEEYTIQSVGTTDYTTAGATDNEVGTIFTATDTPTGTGTVIQTTYFDGNIAVTIDKAATATYPTLVDPTIDVFTTEYNYFYSIDITQDEGTSEGKDNIRVLRGKAAIRV